MSKVTTLIANYTEQKKKFMDIMQSEFKVYVKEFFDENPEIEVIKWVQYTPYFNDGEPCVFRVNDPTFSNSDPENVNSYGELDEEVENEFAFQGTWCIPDSLKNKEKVFDEFSSLICSSEMEDVMLAMFGDHVEVTCTRDNITVNDYDHD